MDFELLGMEKLQVEGDGDRKRENKHILSVYASAVMIRIYDARHTP